jgi:hypothetical protein
MKEIRYTLITDGGSDGCDLFLIDTEENKLLASKASGNI